MTAGELACVARLMNKLRDVQNTGDEVELHGDLTVYGEYGSHLGTITLSGDEPEFTERAL